MEGQLSFLANLNISEDAKKSILQVATSREIKTVVWDRVKTIAKSNPKTQEEAAAKFHEIKGIFSVLIAE